MNRTAYTYPRLTMVCKGLFKLLLCRQSGRKGLFAPIGIVISLCCSVMSIFTECTRCVVLRGWLYDQSAQVHSLETLMETLRRDCPRNEEIVSTYMMKHAKLHAKSSHHSQSRNESGADSAGQADITTWAWLVSGCGCFRSAVAPDSDRESRNSRNESAMELSARKAPSSPRTMQNSVMSTPRQAAASSFEFPAEAAAAREEAVAPAEVVSGAEAV